LLQATRKPRYGASACAEMREEKAMQEGNEAFEFNPDNSIE